MSSTRDRILEKTCELLESQGYHATGLNQIVKESGTPKGSLYYYFPEGKEEITEEAIRRTGELVSERVRANLAQEGDVVQAVEGFVREIARHVELSGFQAGGPLMIVAMETVTGSERINLACREAYGKLHQAFAEKLLLGGFSPERAKQLAAFVLASVEGGIILSRTYHSGDALCHVGEELRNLLQHTSRS